MNLLKVLARKVLLCSWPIPCRMNLGPVKQEKAIHRSRQARPLEPHESIAPLLPYGPQC